MLNMDAFFFLNSNHEQHTGMQNTFQNMQSLQLEIALISVQYKIICFGEATPL